MAKLLTVVEDCFSVVKDKQRQYPGIRERPTIRLILWRISGLFNDFSGVQSKPVYLLKQKF